MSGTSTTTVEAAPLLAVEKLEETFAPLDVVLVESGGDNLTATFSPALVDVQLFVLDVAGGGDVARKGGPGIERADLLVVNKTDLAPYVGVDVHRMVHDAEHARAGRPVLALSRTDPDSVARLRSWVLQRLAQFRGGGRAFGGSGNRLPRPQPPPSCNTEIVHFSFMFVPGMAISISRTLRRTHSASSDSLGTQYLSKLVGS